MKASNKTLLLVITGIFVAFFLGAIVVRMHTKGPGWEVFFKFNQKGIKVAGDGNIVSKPYKLHDFNKIAIGGVGHVQLLPGTPKIVITTDKNLIPYIKTYIVHRELYVSYGDKVNLQPTDNIQIKIFSRNGIKSVKLGGAINFHAKNINVDRFSLISGGVVHSFLAGKTKRLNVILAGASKLDAKHLVAKSVDIKIAGASSTISSGGK